MNHEEKILALLDAQGKTLEKLTDGMADMNVQINHLDERSQRTAVLVEADVSRKLDLLYEGHEAIMERLDKLASKSRLEDLESDVALMKHTIKLMRLELDALKKAQ